MEENLPPFTDLDDPGVATLLRAAAGVVLPPYLPPWRYRRVTQLARAWFPRLEVRLEHLGKTRQIFLFRAMGVRYPESLLFPGPDGLVAYFERHGSPWGYPLVLKGDLGGGGSSVFPIHAAQDIHRRAAQLPPCQPLLIQRWVDHGGRDLRVVVYGRHAVSYFRVGSDGFYNNVCRGGRIDHHWLPERQREAQEAVHRFCRGLPIDMAGFDLMFPDDGPPVFIEINHHFGRKGIGGNREHHRLFRRAVGEWRARLLAAGPS
jgi:ribosomal protein S6--L-glutamate ligase